MSIAAIRGTRDLLPEEIAAWRRVEDAARDVFRRFGYQEIRTPIFEATELFVRGVGEGTDIVDKEMYTFEDKGGRSLTLRPEGTAGVVRACIEHNLLATSPIRKFYYTGPMYRYERPQAGRYREFWQTGIEAFGVAGPLMDAEVLVCAYEFLSALDINGLIVQLNSIGDSERPDYIRVLKAYVQPELERYCPKCQHRYETNPLRLLDCKVPSCRELVQGAPKTVEHLTSESMEHLVRVRRLLDRAKVPYILNPFIVRGLDYYTHTVFEVTAEGLGSQDAILAGGRYDRLMEVVGGKPSPGVGFAAGIDRLVMAIQAQEPAATGSFGIDVYIARIGDAPPEPAYDLAIALRRAGIAVEMDYEGRSLRAQMKSANALGVSHTLLLGEDEIARESVTVRQMDTGAQETLPLTDVVAYLAGRANRPPLG